MGNNKTIHQYSPILAAVGVIIILILEVLPHDALAQSLHNSTLGEVLKQTSGLDEVSHIDVGKSPSAIGVFYDEVKNIVKVYVANRDSDTVSVISGENNTKIGEDIPVGDNPTAMTIWNGLVYVVSEFNDSVSVISGENNTVVKEIPVGKGPRAIDIGGGDSATIFVSNSDDDSVSVISGENNTEIKRIPVGNSPRAIELATIPVSQGESTDEFIENVYTLNAGSDTVSVISGENNTKIGEDIPVGDNPTAIDVNSRTDTLYIANRDSSSISVIDGMSNKVVAGITFQVNPFNSGYILCDGLATPSPIRQYVYVDSGTECTAKPNSGFEFSSWEENLQGNSTQPLKVSGSDSTWDSFVLAITDLFGDKPDKSEAKLNVTKFGTFTANFREAPPPLPQEFWAQMYAVIATVITALFIPSILGWIRSKRDVKKLNYYHKQIASLYGDGQLDENDLDALDRVKSRVIDAYSEGKINEKHYESLENEISVLYEKVFRKRISDLRDNNHSKSTIDKPAQEQFASIRNDLEYAYSEGKLNEKHYDLLTRAISNLESKQNTSQ